MGDTSVSTAISTGFSLIKDFIVWFRAKNHNAASLVATLERTTILLKSIISFQFIQLGKKSKSFEVRFAAAKLESDFYELAIYVQEIHGISSRNSDLQLSRDYLIARCESIAATTEKLARMLDTSAATPPTVKSTKEEGTKPSSEEEQLQKIMNTEDEVITLECLTIKGNVIVRGETEHKEDTSAAESFLAYCNYAKANPTKE